MNIIDHLSLGVPSIAEGRAFYDEVMTTLGCEFLAATEAFAAYGNGAVQFLIMVPADGREYSSGNGTHIAFVATGADAVNACHAAALLNGGVDNGAPGLRPGYPKPDVYTAFVIDPFGNKLEAIFNGFAA